MGLSDPLFLFPLGRSNLLFQQTSRPQRPLGERPSYQSSALQVVLQLDPSGAALSAWSSSCPCSETVLLGCSPPHSPAL
ncbi:hypothetical protein VZT92_018521 [Zoarces viviparus]|uniref:Uncharacterized protein n=1 Tax=Zoarces viviparus TaxID=48416 RepID=A0AAW1EHP2_ZOAVI